MQTIGFRKLIPSQFHKNMQHMHVNIPRMFDSWDDTVVHLLRLKSYDTQK